MFTGYRYTCTELKGTIWYDRRD